MSGSPKPLVFVTVGTDAFPFTRLMRWIEGWLAGGGGARVQMIVQHGPSRPPEGVEAHEFLPYADVRAAMKRAAAIVCHGAGPSVLESLENQTIPIVVPRRRAFGEAVDDHQVAFARRMAAEGLVRLADSPEELAAALDEVANHPDAFKLAARSVGEADAAERFARAVAPLLSGTSPDPTDRPRVLYIAATGRSGSTLVERILGEVPGLCAVGEVVHLWQRGLLRNERCGCGEPFHSCPFWTQVGQEAFGGWEAVDPIRMTLLKHGVDRHRFLPLMLRPSSFPAYQERLERFSEALSALYRAIAKVSGGSIIVDSSKSSSYLFLLRRLGGIDLRMLHLVRDSRGVAYSTTKQVRRPEVRDREAFMPTYHPARAAADWLLYNTLFELAGVSGIPSMRLRYERVIRDPRRYIAHVLRFAGIDDATRLLDFLGTDSVRLGPIHSVSGNPMRFSSGLLPIRLDDEWRHRLAPGHRLTVSLVTWPLLRRYGYALRP